MSHKLNNINSDNVMDALKLANQRLISDKYLNGGMGDGGGCHLEIILLYLGYLKKLI